MLITTESGLIVDSDEGRTASIIQDYQVSLNQGDWTLIGNPYEFPVPLSMILTNEGTYLSDDPNVYEFKNGQWRSASVLEPWSGIAYKSNSASRVFIQPNISGDDNNSFSRKVPFHSNALSDGEWYIDIVADNGFGVDEFNRVGIKHGSKDGYDHRDGYEPPMLPGGVSLRIPHDNWDEHSDIYTTDFREFSDEGQFWDFEVVSGNVDFNTLKSTLYWNDETPQEAIIKDANPFYTLAWVINLRLSLNLNVPKGSKIITGSVIKTRSPKKGDVVTYNVGNLSETKIRLI